MGAAPSPRLDGLWERRPRHDWSLGPEPVADLRSRFTEALPGLRQATLPPPWERRPRRDNRCRTGHSPRPEHFAGYPARTRSASRDPNFRDGVHTSSRVGMPSIPNATRWRVISAFPSAGACLHGVLAVPSSLIPAIWGCRGGPGGAGRRSRTWNCVSALPSSGHSAEAEARFPMHGRPFSPSG